MAGGRVQLGITYLNGALTVGTLDDANVVSRMRGSGEFRSLRSDDRAGDQCQTAGLRPRAICDSSAELRGVIDSVARGDFSDGDADLFQPVVESLLNHDEYL